jgi:hypothetical protein
LGALEKLVSLQDLSAAAIANFQPHVVDYLSQIKLLTNERERRHFLIERHQEVSINVHVMSHALPLHWNDPHDMSEQSRRLTPDGVMTRLERLLDPGIRSKLEYSNEAAK